MTIRASVDERADVSVVASARVIATFALQHLKAAATFRDQVVAIEAVNAATPFGEFFEDIRSYASASIMSAAAALEALINEMFITPEGRLRPLLHNFDIDFWDDRQGIERLPPLKKYQRALSMLGKPQLNTSSAAYRSASGLVELRNALVHFKPSWDPDRRRKVEMVETLSGMYQLSPFVGEGSDFVTMRSMSSGCSAWAVSTVVAFLREFDSLAQLDDHKMSAFWRFEESDRQQANP
ncbi:MAG: hypothetical protein KDH93_14545 [Rhodoferax sp.]|nr:hypothetical protein [Rhodoferax sp.]